MYAEADTSNEPELEMDTEWWMEVCIICSLFQSRKRTKQYIFFIIIIFLSQTQILFLAENGGAYYLIYNFQKI